MSLDKVTSDIKNQLFCANQQVCGLQEKLLTYNDDVDERADLQIRLSNRQQCMEDLENKLQRANAHQKNMIDVQTRKLKKIEGEEAVLRSTNSKFIDINERMTRQICTLKEKENSLLREIKRTEEDKQIIENQLCNVKETTDELSAAVDRLKKCLRSKEEELRCVQAQAEQRREEHRRLCDECCKLESELERTLCESEDAKSRAAAVDERLAYEKRELCCELEAKRTALRAVTEQLTEAKVMADREQARTVQLDRSAAEQRRANEQDKRAAAAQAQRLNKENRGKEVSVCRMKEQIVELRRDADRTVADTRAVQEQARAYKCLLETAKRAAAADAPAERSGRGSGHERQLERDTDALACEVRRKAKKIAELERQVRCLRGELDCAAAKGDRYGACSRPPSPRCPLPPPPRCPLPRPPRCPPPRQPPPPPPYRSKSPPEPSACRPEPKPSCCPPPADSCSSVDLSTAYCCCAPNSTCSGGSDGGGCASDNEVVFNELKQLYCDIENVQKNDDLCLDTLL